MMTPCRARNVISLILLAGLIAQRDARPVELATKQTKWASKKI